MESIASNLVEQLGPLARCFSEEEYAKLREAFLLVGELDAQTTSQIEETFRQAKSNLPLVAQAIESSPRARERQRVGNKERDAESLVEKLCHTDGLCLEFHMPTGAILGRAFVIAKLNFLKAVEYVLEGATSDTRAAVAILKDLVGEAIFSKLAEELLAALIANPMNAMELRRSAARKLIVMWDERVALPVDKLPSVLLSAWRARGKVRAIYGTLIGVNEVFSLIQAECQSRFVNYFVREHVTADEREAFREFLFAISYEDLQQVQKYMREHDLKVIAPREVQSVVKSPMHPLLFGDPSPEQMYTSYFRRRVRADYRAISGSPGPRKTAEGYIMENLLQEEAGVVAD